MSQLTKLVEFLDRDDVTEVVVASGRPVTLRMGGEYRALGKAAATPAQIDALFSGSQVGALIASGGGHAEVMRLAHRDCEVDVQLMADQVLVRITRARPSAINALARIRVGTVSAPVVVAAPPPPRAEVAAPLPRAHEAVPIPPVRTTLREHGKALADVAAGSSDAVEPPADDFGGLITRASDGGGGPGPSAVAREVSDGRSVPTGPGLTPIAPRRRPITMPPVAVGTSPALEPVVVARTEVPINGAGPAASRFSIDLPPGDPGTPPPVVPTAVARPPTRAPAASPAPARTRAVPAATAAPTVPMMAPIAVAPPPAAAPLAGVTTTGYAPARRHTITAAPTLTPLPPLAAGKARAAPELLAILAGARGRNASDLHLTGERPPMERSVRGLEPVGPPLSAIDVERLLNSLLSPDQRVQLDARGYVDAALDVEGAGRLRANISRFRGGVKGSFRLVLSTPPTLEQLGLPRELARVTTYHQGLVVIAGPNGHGKTTTLAALVDLINANKAHHILTIEDPVEIQHPRKRALVSQREVGNHTRSFAAALKASLREDPDVIVIGELRDRETVEIALTAAETGHLVMATMSTPSAAKSLDRLIDMFPPDDQQQVRTSLAAALKFVVAQRLLPTIDGVGVVAAVELLTGVLPLAALIRDNKLFQVSSLQQRGRAFGMIRLDDSLLELVRSGRISEDVALRAAESRKDLANALRAPAAAAARAGEPAKGRLGGLFGAGRRPE